MVIRKQSLRAVAVALAAAVLLASVGPAAAQSLDPLQTVSRNREIVRVQLVMGTSHLEEALRIAQTAEGQQDLERAKDMASRAYILMRFVTEGIHIQKNRTKIKNYTDPLLDMSDAIVWRSRLLNIDARLDLDKAIVARGDNSQYLSQAIQKLQDALQAAQEAVELF